MSKKYTKEALKEAYKEHIIEYMQDNSYDDEIGLDEETAITIIFTLMLTATYIQVIAQFQKNSLWKTLKMILATG